MTRVMYRRERIHNWTGKCEICGQRLKRGEDAVMRMGWSKALDGFTTEGFRHIGCHNEPIKVEFSIDAFDKLRIVSGLDLTSDKTALQCSIQKWEAIVAHYADPDNKLPIHDGATDTCACCRLHWSFDQKYTCHGCPIRDHTGRNGCDMTPYDDYANALDALYEYDDEEPDEETLARILAVAKTAARAELEFLQDLLAKESNNHE